MLFMFLLLSIVYIYVYFAVLDELKLSFDLRFSSSTRPRRSSHIAFYPVSHHQGLWFLVNLRKCMVNLCLNMKAYSQQSAISRCSPG